MPLRLALSLHAPDDALRSQIMPVNDRYPLAEVLDACERVLRAQAAPGLHRVRDARRGQRPLRRRPSRSPGCSTARVYKVNLIPYNPTDAPTTARRRGAIDAFRAALEEHGMRATVRLTRGRDIDAACGQLAAKALAAAG